MLHWMKSVGKSVGKSKGRLPRCSASQFLLQQQIVNTFTVLRSLGRRSERLANDYTLALSDEYDDNSGLITAVIFLPCGDNISV